MNRRVMKVLGLEGRVLARLHTFEKTLAVTEAADSSFDMLTSGTTQFTSQPLHNCWSRSSNHIKNSLQPHFTPPLLPFHLLAPGSPLSHHTYTYASASTICDPSHGPPIPKYRYVRIAATRKQSLTFCAWSCQLGGGNAEEGDKMLVAPLSSL